MDKALRARVPLYSGVTAETGATEQQIIDTLRALLLSDGIAGDVQVIPFGGSASSTKAIMFRVGGVPMPIKTMNFPGASAVSEKELEAAASKIIGQDFSITNVTEFEPVGLLPLYRQKGYLRTAFDRPQWAVIANPSAGSSPEIAVTLSVKEGAQYFWDKVDWAGNRQFSADQLEQTLSMKHGEIANQQKIDDGLQTIRRSYDKLGYIDASVQPRVDLDDSKLLASYAVRINESVQYHMGKLQFAGIPEKAANDLCAKWQMKPGAVFDGSYPMDFVDNIAIHRLSEMGIKKAKANFGFRRDTQNATVDVQVAFQ